MNRILAIILTALMVVSLFSASMVVHADTVTKKGFYLVNWNDLDNVGEYTYDHVYYMPFTWINSAKLDVDPLPVLFKYYNTTNIQKAAQMMYDDFSQRPEGARVFNFAALGTILKKTVVDVVDMEKGVALASKWLDAFLAEYKALGGELDGIAIDLEYNKCYTYYIETEQYTAGNPDIYNQIVNNPVYREKIRPELVKQGFVFYENPDPAKYPERSEIWTIYRSDKDGGNSLSRSIWGQTMQRLLVDYINRSAFDPLMKYYPNAFLSDYKTGDVDTWYKPLDTDGTQLGYSYVKAGNTSNYNAYQWQPTYGMFGYASESDRSNRSKYIKPVGYNDAVYPDSSYGQFLYEINMQKRMLLSTENGRVNAWLTFFNYGGKKTTSYANSAYYTEHIYHTGLSNSETFLGYVIASEVSSKGSKVEDKNVGNYGYNLKVIDDALAELTRVAGTSDRKAIVMPMDWNGYVLSGMYTGGRNIWRITPDTDKVSLEDFKVKDTAPTFCVDGVTITFPQGRIIEDGDVRQVGSCGYWIETPADMVPVVTATADRYSESPSFVETFDYDIGKFTSATAAPHTYWTASNGFSVVDNGGNKALSVTGGTVLTCSKVTEKITAGDYYAKQQAWEVTVTLPAGNYGTLRLFNYSNSDGGFKIEAGKVYYHTNKDYQELEGVSLTAGTYRFKREMDFRQSDNFTCTYSVYDADGKLLATVEDVQIKKVTLPVSEITMYTKGVEDPILVDDFKLYPTGVTTALDLYGAEYGRKVSNADEAQTVDTAFRLSWMNAGDTHQVARVYDANSGTILKKIEMAPGTHGVATGVVEIADGREVLFAVHVTDGAALVHPDYDAGDFAWTSMAENLGLATGKKGSSGLATPIPTGDGIGEAGDSIFPILGIVVDDGSGNDGNSGGGKNISGNIIPVIVLASLAVLTGICAVAYRFTIKPKRNARSGKKSTEE